MMKTKDSKQILSPFFIKTDLSMLILCNMITSSLNPWSSITVQSGPYSVMDVCVFQHYMPEKNSRRMFVFSSHPSSYPFHCLLG